MACQEETIKSQSIFSLTVEELRRRTWLVSGSRFNDGLSKLSVPFSSYAEDREDREDREQKANLLAIWGKRSQICVLERKDEEEEDRYRDRTDVCSVEELFQEGTDICSA